MRLVAEKVVRAAELHEHILWIARGKQKRRAISIMARLVLEDGSEYRGTPFGALKSTTGEIGKSTGKQ